MMFVMWSFIDQELAHYLTLVNKNDISNHNNRIVLYKKDKKNSSIRDEDENKNKIKDSSIHQRNEWNKQKD